MKSEIVAALGLLMILEGILPILSPRGLKTILRRIASMHDRDLRWVGLASVLFGLLLIRIFQ